MRERQKCQAGKGMRQAEAQGWKDGDLHLLCSLLCSLCSRIFLEPTAFPGKIPRLPAEQVFVPFFCWAGVGERELAEDTGLARSAYMSSESALRTELLLDEALDTEETLLTLRDLPRTNSSHHTPGPPASPCMAGCWEARQAVTHQGCVSWGAAGMKFPKLLGAGLESDDYL